MYKISQFIINRISEGVVIQNSNGINFIKDIKLGKFLEYIDENNINVFSLETFRKFFEEQELEKYMEFLKSSEIIVDYDLDYECYISKIGIYSNCNLVEEYFNFISNEKFEVFYDIEEGYKYDIIVLFFCPFILQEYNNLVDKLKKFNIPLMTCFCYNNKFYISNLYKSDWCNPCPKCFFSNLETSLRAYGNMQNSPSFQTIVDLIYSYNCNFKIEFPIDKKILIYIICEIIKIADTDINILANKIVEIDLNGNISYDVPTHWEICDCFE